jgi:hypothetical protein
MVGWWSNRSRRKNAAKPTRAMTAKSSSTQAVGLLGRLKGEDGQIISFTLHLYGQIISFTLHL